MASFYGSWQVIKLQDPPVGVSAVYASTREPLSHRLLHLGAPILLVSTDVLPVDVPVLLVPGCHTFFTTLLQSILSLGSL